MLVDLTLHKVYRSAREDTTAFIISQRDQSLYLDQLLENLEPLFSQLHFFEQHLPFSVFDRLDSNVSDAYGFLVLGLLVVSMKNLLIRSFATLRTF